MLLLHFFRKYQRNEDPLKSCIAEIKKNFEESDILKDKISERETDLQIKEDERQRNILDVFIYLILLIDK